MGFMWQMRRKLSKKIDCGSVVKRLGEPCERVDYEMIFAEEKHLADIMKLQEIIVQGLENETLFNPSSTEFMRQHIESKGLTICIYAENELIAYNSIYFPELDEPDYYMGADVNLPIEEIDKVANFNNVLVHPQYRGNKLGLKTNNYVCHLLKSMNYRHFFATVSPSNIPSIRLFLDSGFIIRGLKYKYSGKLRYVFYQDCEKPPKSCDERDIALNNMAIEEQQQILKQGYCGVDIRSADKGFEILYRMRTFEY
jgi:ribosomal protein S18 acetylase RimI-like enzyme